MYVVCTTTRLFKGLKQNNLRIAFSGPEPLFPSHGLVLKMSANDVVNVLVYVHQRKNQIERHSLNRW